MLKFPSITKKFYIRLIRLCNNFSGSKFSEEQKATLLALVLKLEALFTCSEIEKKSYNPLQLYKELQEIQNIFLKFSDGTGVGTNKYDDLHTAYNFVFEQYEAYLHYDDEDILKDLELMTVFSLYQFEESLYGIVTLFCDAIVSEIEEFVDKSK